jgi:hypothetical protein
MLTSKRRESPEEFLDRKGREYLRSAERGDLTFVAEILQAYMTARTLHKRGVVSDEAAAQFNRRVINAFREVRLRSRSR